MLLCFEHCPVVLGVLNDKDEQCVQKLINGDLMLENAKIHKEPLTPPPLTTVASTRFKITRSSHTHTL